jgi:C-terminal processing protease CtpA/Prc
MRTFTAILACMFVMPLVFAQTKFQEDFSFYWQTINDNFAYFDQRKTNWDKVKTIYQPMVDTIKDETAFIHLLERVNHELYNGHVFLNRNTTVSNRIIPSGADLKAVYINKEYVIAEVRKEYNADLCRIKRGMVILKYNDVPVDSAVREFLPRSFSNYDKAVYEYAINMLLAGRHHVKRKITVLVNQQEKDFYPDTIPNKTEETPRTLLDQRISPRNTGYIKINNSLGDTGLINEFDAALDSLMGTRSLVLDLRETPGGGNTTVARALMGRFIDHEMPYQKHIYINEERTTGIKRSTLEIVSPRRRPYLKPMVILVGYWTASMGEGIAIGFDGMKRGLVRGTKMAGLLGEVYTFETPHLKIPFSFPCVKLQNIYGQPREDFLPLPPNLPFR